MFLYYSTATVSGASFTSCTADVRRTHNSRRHSRTAIACRQPTPTYNATPHSTTRRHTSHPPPSPPYTPLFPLRGQGTTLTSVPAMPYPSARALTHPHPESSSSSTPPTIPHCHQPRTPLFQSSDDTTPHPMRPTLAPATNGRLILHTPHSTLHSLPPPSPSSFPHPFFSLLCP